MLKSIFWQDRLGTSIGKVTTKRDKCVFSQAHQLKELLYLTTANQQIGDWSIFYVDPAVSGAAGWPPHRDRGTDDSASAFRRDGTPKYCTVWVPLTDASTLNSCLTVRQTESVARHQMPKSDHFTKTGSAQTQRSRTQKQRPARFSQVVPRQHDPGYSGGDQGANPLARIFSTPEKFQQIRSLPCPAGSLIAFTHRLLHWCGENAGAFFWSHFFPDPSKRGSIHQDRLGTNIGKVEKREIAFRRGSAADPHSGAAPRVALSFAAADPSFEPGYFARKTEQVNKRKRVFFCNKRYRFKLNKSIILPRQARDKQLKHGESSTQK